MKKPWFLRGIRICGGWGFAVTTIYAFPISRQGAFSSPCWRPPASSVMKRSWFLRGTRIGGGWGFAVTTIYAFPISGQGASSSPS